jgi:protein tyrosine/serine phosphatase
MMRPLCIWMLLVVAAFGCGCAPAVHMRADWAQPLHDEEIPNFHRVGPELYRGAQPTPEGFRRLEAMGIRTIINVRSSHSDAELLAGTRLQLEEIPTTAWGTQQHEAAVRFLQVVSQPQRGPFFVHCNFGGDRTGLMVAVYRLCVCGWTKEQTLEEMRDEQFEFHEVWDDLTAMIRDLDVDDLRSRAGLTSSQPQAAGR